MRRALFTIMISLAVALPTLLIAADCSNTSQTGTQGKFVPLACYKGTALESAYNSEPTGQNSLADIFNNAYRIAISVGVTIALIQVIRAAFKYLGNDMWSSKTEARAILSNVIVGVLALLLPFIIFRLINPDMLNLQIGFLSA